MSDDLILRARAQQAMFRVKSLGVEFFDKVEEEGVLNLIEDGSVVVVRRRDCGKSLLAICCDGYPASDCFKELGIGTTE